MKRILTKESLISRWVRETCGAAAMAFEVDLFPPVGELQRVYSV